MKKFDPYAPEFLELVIDAKLTAERLKLLKEKLNELLLLAEPQERPTKH